MVQAWVGQKLLKSNISKVFLLSNGYGCKPTLPKVMLNINTPFKQFNLLNTIQTKFIVVLVKCLASVLYVIPLWLVGASFYLAPIFNELTINIDKKNCHWHV
jgi:hypothetical protein